MLSNRARKVAGGTLCVVAFAVVVGMRTIATTDAAPAVDLKPFAHWVFTPEAVQGKTIAAKVGTLTGKLLGKPTVTDGPPTHAITFAAPTDGVMIQEKVTPAESYLPKEAFSIVTWVRIDATTEWGGLFGCMQDNGPREKGLILGFNKNTFYFGLATKGADDGDGKITYMNGKTNYAVGNWYHVAATYDGKRMRLYVNGKLDAEGTDQSGQVLYADSAPLVIGRYQDDDEDYPMQGAIREVLWCNTALSPELIANHFKPDAQLAAQKAPIRGPKFVVEPYLQFATRTSIVTMCETNVSTKCVVEYGSKYPPDQKIEVGTSATMHEVKLDKLEPNTKYFYRFLCTDGDSNTLTSKPFTFMTACDETDAYSFTVIGDTQRNPVITGKIAKLMWERRPNFVLHMGDVVDDGRDKKQWTDELFKPCHELFSRVVMYPCIGNHEKNHAQYYQYFSLPKPEYYYSFKYGNAEFFSLDTNKPVGPGTEQYVWLEKSLAASDAKWKFCYHHHPCYTSDSDDYGDTWKGTSKLGDKNAQSLIPLYEKYKVDVAMNGHIHLYERTWPIRAGKVDAKNGVVYITSGGGGGSLEDVQPTPAFYKNQGRVDYHYCYFNIHLGVLECKVFDHEGRLFDMFTMKKD